MVAISCVCLYNCTDSFQPCYRLEQKKWHRQPNDVLVPIESQSDKYNRKVGRRFLSKICYEQSYFRGPGRSTTTRHPNMEHNLRREDHGMAWRRFARDVIYGRCLRRSPRDLQRVYLLTEPGIQRQPCPLKHLQSAMLLHGAIPNTAHRVPLRDL